jgi:hypothetical protein
VGVGIDIGLVCCVVACRFPCRIGFISGLWLSRRLLGFQLFGFLLLQLLRKLLLVLRLLLVHRLFLVVGSILRYLHFLGEPPLLLGLLLFAQRRFGDRRCVFGEFDLFGRRLYFGSLLQSLAGLLSFDPFKEVFILIVFGFILVILVGRFDLSELALIPGLFVQDLFRITVKFAVRVELASLRGLCLVLGLFLLVPLILCTWAISMSRSAELLRR